MKHDVQFTLSYDGGISDKHEIDLYDVAQALIGFQRSLALTTHLILNNEIITQAPSLKGADIHALPARDGSWKITAGVILAGLFHLGTAQKDSPIGHLIYSAYDYVISESLGVHVDYNKSLGQLYEQAHKNNIKVNQVKEYQLDSVIEKCHTAIREIHRPIYKTETADNATITSNASGQILRVGPIISRDTYEYMNESITEEMPKIIAGRVSSYNSNTYKGRIYVSQEGRPVTFELSENIRSPQTVKIVVNSLSENALQNYNVEGSLIYCRVLKNKSKAGHLKSYKVIEVSSQQLRPLFQ